MTNLSGPATSLTVEDVCELMLLSLESPEHDSLREIMKLRHSNSWHYWNFVDALHQLQVHEQTLEPRSLEFAEAIFPMAANLSFPRSFRLWISHRVLTVYASSIERTDARWLKLLGIIAHTAPKGQLREGAFALLVKHQGNLGAGNLARMSALANLAVIYEETGRLEEAVGCFRQALQLGSQEYLSLRLSQCLAKLGQYEEAYKLVSDFAQWYFSSEDADEGDEILHEARLA